MASGSDEQISGTKITPLESENKHGVQRDMSGGGVIGQDDDIDKSRANPLGGAGESLFILYCTGFEARHLVRKAFLPMLYAG